MTVRAALALATVLAAIGCRGTDPKVADAPPPLTEMPARIVAPTPDSRAALHAVVVAALNGADVTLAADALVQSSVLVVGPPLVRDAQSHPLMGRDRSQPARFQLLRVGDACVLVLRGTGERWTLSHTRCVAE